MGDFFATAYDDIPVSCVFCANPTGPPTHSRCGPINTALPGPLACMTVTVTALSMNDIVGTLNNNVVTAVQFHSLLNAATRMALLVPYFRSVGYLILQAVPGRAILMPFSGWPIPILPTNSH